ncbi:MAG: GH23 [uncultured Acetobacteraceae bacterium]|uniref:GH23 n=1 Tax=uncultured Acetobacteraceae bacterium TaxID=169975 RepID=A0A6J4IER3_9PROT|nr:MAG: GH23 [uncultured Acetobacteraceae bacterium]
MRMEPTSKPDLRHTARRRPHRLALSAAAMLSLGACAGGSRNPDPRPLDARTGLSSSDATAAAVRTLVPLDVVAQRTPPSATGDPLRDIQEDAERHLSAFCAQLWGSDNVWLPAKKQWVYYGEGWTSRGRMDFEAGEFQAQALVEPDADAAAAIEPLRTIVDQAVKDTPPDMARHDSTMRYAKRLAAARGVAIEPVPPAPSAAANEPVSAGVIEPGASERLSPGALARSTTVGTDGKRRTVLTYRVPFQPGYRSRLAARYADLVREEAGRFGLKPSLVFAVIETESAFNPRATSPAPAYGLMQLVPTSGGRDSYHFVHGVRAVPGPEFLYDPANNIKLGAAYLKILDSNHLAGITDPQSRLYGTIAAYNTGSGNVARAFHRTTSIRAAAQTINQMPADAVYEHLRTQLPYEETRHYIAKVTEAQRRYRDWDEAPVAQVSSDRP